MSQGRDRCSGRQGWVDFAALKRAVRMEQVLKHYGVEGLRGSGRDQYRGPCPIHRGQGRESFHVHLTRNLFHCFGCGAGGGVLEFVAAMEGCPVRQAALQLQQWWGVPAAAQPAGWPAAPTRKQLVTKKRSLPPLGFVLRDVDGAHPYLAQRGISGPTANQFGVGFYAGPGLLSRRLVIPIHDDQGRLVAYCGRSLDGAEPRYRFPPGFAKSQVVFNLHRAVATGESRVVVVEGFFDCLTVHQAGSPCVVALMGAALYEPQEMLLRERFRQVVLMLDGDPVGRRATGSLAGRLASHCTVRVIELALNTQPDQLPAGRIRQLIGGASGLASNRDVEGRKDPAAAP